MNTPRLAPALLLLALATPLWAQSVVKPLDLKLPPSDLPAASTTTAPATRTQPRPGVYYGDTSGRSGNPVAQAPVCDDAAYNQPQIHGSVGVGVMGGRRMSGDMHSGTVSLSQAFGSCDDPGGGIGISISTERAHWRTHGH